MAILIIYLSFSGSLTYLLIIKFTPITCRKKNLEFFTLRVYLVGGKNRALNSSIKKFLHFYLSTKHTMTHTYTDTNLELFSISNILLGWVNLLREKMIKWFKIGREWFFFFFCYISQEREWYFYINLKFTVSFEDLIEVSRDFL